MATLFDSASLALIPSGVKESKLYSIKPTDGDGDFTFSRGTDTATRVNASGLIEKERANLILQSNTFSTTWTLSNASVTGGQSGYDGSSDAWLLEVVSGGSSGSVRQSVSESGVSTFSVYVKAGNVDFAALYVSSSGADFSLWADLSSGTIGTTNNEIDTTIASVGGGWYRISITGIDADSTARVYPADADDSFSTTSGHNIYIQDAMLNQGLVAQPYIETTTAAVYEGITDNLPRLDYSGGASCPSLLLEPSRTNLATHSEYFGAWTKAPVSITITDNAAISPEGVQNAAYVQFTAGSQYIRIGASGTSATYTGSVYIKGTAGETIQLSVAGVDSGLKTLTGGWDRIESTQTGASTHFLIHTFGGATARNMYVYGAQLEAGSYPTSYIPTYGTSASRAVDVCSKTSVSDLIGQTEGVLYSEFIVNGFADYGTPLCINNGSTTESIWLTTFANGDIRAEVFSNTGGGVQASFIKSGNVTGQVYKIAIAYASNNFAFYVNGTQVGSTDTSGSVPVGMNRVDFDYVNATSFTKSALEIKQALLFKTRLTNAELAALTTI